MNIFPDTNFLIYCAKQRIDFASEISRIFPKYKIYLLSAVKGELENLLRKEKGKLKESLKLALELADDMEKKGIISEKESASGNADEALIKFDTPNSVIATVDKELKERFKNAKILTIRQKRYLFLS